MKKLCRKPLNDNSSSHNHKSYSYCLKFNNLDINQNDILKRQLKEYLELL